MACLMVEFSTDVKEEIVTKKSHDFEEVIEALIFKKIAVEI